MARNHLGGMPARLGAFCNLYISGFRRLIDAPPAPRGSGVRSGNGPAVSRRRQGSAPAVRASSHRADERTVDERGLGLSQIRLGAERDQRPVIGALVIRHEHQSRIVKQEPAVIKPGSEHRVRAAATGLRESGIAGSCLMARSTAMPSRSTPRGFVPELSPGDVVVMDNLSSHKGPNV